MSDDQRPTFKTNKTKNVLDKHNEGWRAQLGVRDICW